MKTGLNNAVNKTHILFNDFIHICLDTISLQVRSEERVVFAGETVMRDTRQVHVYSHDCTKSYLTSTEYSIHFQ